MMYPISLLPVSYPVRHWRWSSSSLSSAYAAYAAVLKLRNDDTAGSTKREQSTMTNELIGDQWRLPHLEHEPAFRCHGASHMQRINSLSGVLGYTTGQCMLDYIHAIVEFMSQPQYGDLIPMFNEVQPASPALDATSSPRCTLPSPCCNYLQARNMIRDITGNGPFIWIHDGFQSITWWTSFPPGSDRIRHASILCV
ncbi:hypothetical protein B0H14DRAFT_3872002 [Mycena olivaceomarginata]|nr:hypothetical protein B0H14DRAFT_3872002 [Mycena olivaceomarginata]